MWCKPSAKRARPLLLLLAGCAHIRYVVFALMPCFHSPRAIAGCSGQYIVRFEPQKTKPNKFVLGDLGPFGPFWVPFFWKLVIAWDRGNRNRPNPTQIGTTQTHYYYVLVKAKLFRLKKRGCWHVRVRGTQMFIKMVRFDDMIINKLVAA